MGLSERRCGVASRITWLNFLLSPQRQSELTELLHRVQELSAIADHDPRMRHIHHDWLDAGERTQATVRLLSEQLRTFLDDQVWLENRRVMDVLRSIEAHALSVREHPSAAFVMEIDAVAPTITLAMERPLYRPGGRAVLDSDVSEPRVDEAVDVSALFEQVYVDPARLAATVRQALARSPVVRLSQVIADHPLEQGLAELVTYLTLTDPAFDIVLDDAEHDQVNWVDLHGATRRARLPRVVFSRTTTAEVSAA